MKKKIIFFATFAISLTFISLIFLWTQNNVHSQQFEQLANEQFVAQVGPDVLIDQALSIEVFGIARDFGNLYPTVLDFMVANLSSEAIVFPDTYYGVNVYKWDSQASNWIIVKMNLVPFQLQTILQPGDKSKIAPRNGLTLFGEDFIDQDLTNVRIYISGIGASSGIKYGDYIDVQLKNP
ncbi:MAG: hypothetical protein HUU38_19045 [Anaerolineales bacterium]|nr:hypothetical protein [Anaerolineales bacterium]